MAFGWDPSAQGAHGPFFSEVPPGPEAEGVRLLGRGRGAIRRECPDRGPEHLPLGASVAHAAGEGEGGEEDQCGSIACSGAA